MEPEVAQRILDAVEAIRLVGKFTAKLSFEQFSRDDLVRSAVERQFEIVGEALGRADNLEPGIETKIPDLRKIVGLRNRLIHGYANVDDEIIWDAVKTKVLPLRETLEAVLKTAGYPTGADSDCP